MRILRVFLDLDGVIIDFAQGCIDWYNLDCTPEDFLHWGAIFKYFNGNESEFWDGLTHKFWLGLKFTKEAKRILTLVDPLKPCLLTSPPWHGAGGKQDWIQNEMPDYFKDGRYLIGPAKHYAAWKESVLIDDSEDNIEKFKDAGGHAIMVPRPWNNLRGKDVLKHIKNGLNVVKGGVR